MTAESWCRSMPASVSAITDDPQAALLAARYGPVVDQIRDLDTPADRIAFAIERSEMTLETLAAKIGCSHAALSQWRSGKTDASHIKAGLLQAFADATNTDVRWLLTGKGPVVSRYMLTAEMTRLGSALAVMERTAPSQVETIVKMVEAAAKSTAN
jgi:transcriptional regulator with XRE-family HTH domain